MATILIYGAAGHTGRLIARRAARLGGHRYVLASRRRDPVQGLATELGFEYRNFALDRPEQVRTGLDGVDAVVNAAGPFAFTAEPLAKSAIAQRAHYVDICGEVDVYRRLRRLGPLAQRQGVAVVCGAAQTPGVSSLLLAHALQSRRSKPKAAPALGDVRIGMTRPTTLSGGSLRTFWESMQDHVVIARPSGTLRSVPVGRLQHPFRFGGGEGEPLRLAVASNLLDTLAADELLQEEKIGAGSVVSYIEAGAWARLAADLGAFVSPLSRLPVLGRWGSELVSALSTAEVEGRESRHAVVVQVEDATRRLLVDRLAITPGVYATTAALALRAAHAVLNGLAGWVPPGRALASSGKAEDWWAEADWTVSDRGVA